MTGNGRSEASRRAIPDATVVRLPLYLRALVSIADSGDATAARTLIHDHITGYYAEAGLARA